MSGTIRFISDPHFGHKNMATHRGFHDELCMNEYIIDQWNKTVNKRDTTWILGDITMEKNEYWQSDFSKDLYPEERGRGA